MQTYLTAAAFMDGLASMEDWGCGLAYLKDFLDDPSIYVGVDGSASLFATDVDDIATRRTTVDGIVIRHVLEHNHNWRDILDNAVRSATRRLCIVLFTPLADETRVLMTEPDYGDVPVISFSLEDLCDRLRKRPEARWDIVTIDSPSVEYGQETVIRVLFGKD